MKQLRSLGCALAMTALAACGGAEAVAPQPELEIRAQESTADGTLGSGGRRCEDTPDGCASTSGGGNKTSGG